MRSEPEDQVDEEVAATVRRRAAVQAEIVELWSATAQPVMPPRLARLLEEERALGREIRALTERDPA